MKYLKIYESIEIDNLLKKYARKKSTHNNRHYSSIDFPKKYTINKDGSVDTDNVYLIDMNLTKIPIKFGKISGNFYCFHFLNSHLYNSECEFKLITLENSPRYIGKDFNCSGNELTTLLHGPQYVGGEYSCFNNNLKDFYGFPEKFFGRLYISNNPVYEILYFFTNLVLGMELIETNKFIHFLNYNHAIRNGDTIIQDRLMEAIYETGKNIDTSKFDKLKFKNYKII